MADQVLIEMYRAIVSSHIGLNLHHHKYDTKQMYRLNENAVICY